jgi:hypothetical protein
MANRCSSARYEVGHNYLIQDNEEEFGYGLYSYLLFSEKPDDILMEKYIATIEATLNKIPEIEDLEYYISKDSLNILYIPLLYTPDSNFAYFTSKEKSEWIINNYDYGRARVYLNKFKENLDSGPYIISYTKALTQVNQIKDKYLIQDLSYVHHRVIPLWIDEFLEQSSKAHFWDEKELQNFRNDLRNSIAVAADGLTEVTGSLNWWKDSLKDWIALK